MRHTSWGVLALVVASTIWAGTALAGIEEHLPCPEADANFNKGETSESSKLNEEKSPEQVLRERLAKIGIVYVSSEEELEEEEPSANSAASLSTPGAPKTSAPSGDTCVAGYDAKGTRCYSQLGGQLYQDESEDEEVPEAGCSATGSGSSSAPLALLLGLLGVFALRRSPARARVRR
jgi:hypothetical protein